MLELKVNDHGASLTGKGKQVEVLNLLANAVDVVMDALAKHGSSEEECAKYVRYAVDTALEHREMIRKPPVEGGMPC